MKKKITIFTALILIFSLIIVTSCNKHDKPVALIKTCKLVGDKKLPVEGANVVILSDNSLNSGNHKGDVSYINPDSLILRKNFTTDNGGIVKYESEYEQILQVYASYNCSNNDLIEGYGAIVLTNDNIYQETIILKKRD